MRFMTLVALITIATTGICAEPTGKAQLTLQQGVNDYSDAWTDSNEKKAIKIHPKNSVVLGWKNIHKHTRGKRIQVTSAQVGLYYCDEFWSFYHYTIGVLDAKKANDKNLGSTIIFGDRLKNKTPINSWVYIDIDPQIIQQWLDQPQSNNGLILKEIQRKDPPGKKSGGGFTVYRPMEFRDISKRPKLIINYSFSGNVAPSKVTLQSTYNNAEINGLIPLQWKEADILDANNDPVHYELRYGIQQNANTKWETIANKIPSGTTSYQWDSSKVKAGSQCLLQIRATDNRGESSAWHGSTQAFTISKHKKAYNISTISSMKRIRRFVEPGLKPATTHELSLAQGEYESVQLVISNVTQNLNKATLKIGSFKNKQGKTLNKSAFSWNPVGFVKTKKSKHYISDRTGWHADPLLPAQDFELESLKTHAIWLRVQCPRGIDAGIYTGIVSVEAEGYQESLSLNIQVFDFELPIRGSLKTMAIDASLGSPMALYNVPKNSDASLALTKDIYSTLCDYRLPPGGAALCGFTWNKPNQLIGRNKDGSYDFSKVDEWAEFLIPKGLNAFVIAKCPKPGKWGFPKQYSKQWRKDWSDFVSAYSKHLKQKGWADMAYTYNIDEAPKNMWPAAKENYAMSKAAAKDIPMMQCLNDPKGVAALSGYADTWDVTGISQYHSSGVAQRQKKGDEVWWCICCYPSEHPNLFIDYPVMEGRILGWYSWKLGVSGFEYWAAMAWGIGKKNSKAITEIESAHWNTTVFGDYNGDGYLFYPGANKQILSSLRAENLRDGIEDYEYFAILKKRLANAKKSGSAYKNAVTLLQIPNEICHETNTFTSDETRVQDYRQRLALAIESLPQ